MSEKLKTKLIFEEEIECPYCNKLILLQRVKKTITEPEKGEYEEETIVKKSEQEKLV